MPEFEVNDQAVSISPKEFIKVVDLNSRMVTVATLKWYFGNDCEAEKICDQYAEHLIEEARLAKEKFEKIINSKK